MTKSFWMAAAAALAVAGSAAAQPPGSGIQWSDAPQSRSQPELHQFAACVARGETRRARDVLAMD